MNYVVDREADNDDSGYRLGHSELPSTKHHGSCDAAHNEDHGDDGIDGDNDVLSGEKHDHEGK